MRLDGSEPKNNKKIIRKDESESVSTPLDPYKKPERHSIDKTGREPSDNIDYRSIFGILPTKPMVPERQSIQAIPEEISPRMKLHQRLESGGGYERLEEFDPRRRRMLQTYLTTEKTLSEIAQEEGLSKTQAHQQIHAGMDVAFFELPEDQRAEYGNDPANAIKTRTAQQTNAKSERISQAADKRKNPDTGKIDISESQRDSIGQAATRRWQQYREGMYTGRPVGRPPKSGNTPKNEATEGEFQVGYESEKHGKPNRRSTIRITRSSGR